VRLDQSLRLREERLEGGIAVLVPPLPGVVFTTRGGGCSPPPFSSLNLSTAVGDAEVAVAENRRRLSEALRIPRSWVTARQVHGCGVATVANVSTERQPPEADALIAARDDPPVVMLVADCVPVALVGTGVTAVVHAGWRGLSRGVVEAAVHRVGGSPAAWIGPCIGPCCYEVGPEVPAQFATAHPGAPDCSAVVEGSLRFDLRKAAMSALEAAGAEVFWGQEVPCTSCDPRFFSHRRDAGRTGRQAVIAWRGSSFCP
jgi:YfiH family protein